MDANEKAALAARALDGYVHGATAATEATRKALRRVPTARAVVLVEGVSDQIAVEATARVVDRDLEADGVVVLPVGGAHGIPKYLAQLGHRSPDLAIAGLCDAREAAVIGLGLESAGIGPINGRSDLEAAGFYVCDEDLEDELIRAVGSEDVIETLATQGDLHAFRTLQRQPEWRDQALDAQLRRFLAAGATRKSRYARLLTEALDESRLPAPLRGCLDAV